MSDSDIILKEDGGVLITGSSEVVSTGTGAGYAFVDRTHIDQRWVWYSDKGYAYLYRDGTGNVISIDSDGYLRQLRGLQTPSVFIGDALVKVTDDSQGLGITITPSSIVLTYHGAPSTTAPPHQGERPPAPGGPVKTLDLVAEVIELRKELEQIKARLSAGRQ